MKFDYEGKTYVLEFERDHKQLTLLRGGRKETVKSKHPYTTATLYVQTSPTTRAVVTHATVGCCPTDSYSNAAGRLFALRSLTGNLKKLNKDRDFRAALWKTYVDRDKRPAKVVEGEVVKETIH